MRQSRWWRGWLRVAVVVYVIAWPASWVWLVRDGARNEWLVLEHLSPTYAVAGIFPPSRWCARIATDDFLQLPLVEHERQAALLFDKEIAPLLDDFLYKREPFRRDFIRAAGLSLDAMPIEIWYQDSGVYPREVRYRAVAWHAFPSRDYVRFAGMVSLVAGFWVAVVLVPALALATAVRWIIRGFRAR
jgi:hypothetical protein